MFFFRIAIFQQVERDTVIVHAANMAVPAGKAVDLVVPVILFLLAQTFILLIDGRDTALFVPD